MNAYAIAGLIGTVIGATVAHVGAKTVVGAHIDAAKLKLIMIEGMGGKLEYVYVDSQGNVKAKA